MTDGQGNDHFFFEQRSHDETCHQIGFGRTDEGGIDRFVVQALHQLAAAAFFQDQRYEWRHFTKGANHARHERMEGRRSGKADHDATLLAACRSPCRGECAIDLFENVARTFEKDLARIRELDTARHATKELHAQLALERADLLTQRRLLHAESTRSTRDMAFFGDSDEIA